MLNDTEMRVVWLEVSPGGGGGRNIDNDDEVALSSLFPQSQKGQRGQSGRSARESSELVNGRCSICTTYLMKIEVHYDLVVTLSHVNLDNLESFVSIAM